MLIHKFHKPFVLGGWQIYVFLSSPGVGMEVLGKEGVREGGGRRDGMGWGQKGDVVSALDKLCF